MTNPIDTQILDLNRPGVVIEVDARTAEALGACEEDALDEAEALESADTDGQGGRLGGGYGPLEASRALAGLAAGAHGRQACRGRTAIGR